MPDFSREQYQIMLTYLFMLTVDGKNVDKDNYLQQFTGKFLNFSSDKSEVINYCNSISVGKSKDNSDNVIKEILKLCYPSAESKLHDYEKVIKTFTPTSVKKMSDMINLERVKNTTFSFRGFKYEMTIKGNSEKIKLMCSIAETGFKDYQNIYGEKKVLAFIGAILGLDHLIVAEFIDTIDTILEIENQKNFIKSLNRPYVVISEKLKEHDKNVEMLKNNIKIMIQEAGIA